MDWPATIEKAGAALAGVIAALGGVAAARARKTKLPPAPKRLPPPPPSPASEPCPERLGEIDAEIARLWTAVGDLREELRLARAEIAVERHDRQSVPGARRG